MTLESIIEDFEAMAEWRDELRSKVRRAALRFEFCELDADEQEQLTAEVQSFREICRCLASLIRSEAA